MVERRFRDEDRLRENRDLLGPSSDGGLRAQAAELVVEQERTEHVVDEYR